VFQEEPGEELV